VTGPQDDGKREQPICVAVVICNDIIEDKRSNNKTLVNLFNDIAVSTLPILYPRMYFMATLTNGVGRYTLSFRIKGPSDKELARFTGEAFFADPLTLVDIVVEIQGLRLEEEGTHFVDILSGDYPLGHRRFVVRKPPREQKQKPGF
jgi:hypothetical protein